jgi:tRNA threonylcarbamoyladenosine modification (KEOPS) complex  Pcc1 subunit
MKETYVVSSKETVLHLTEVRANSEEEARRLILEGEVDTETVGEEQLVITGIELKGRPMPRPTAQPEQDPLFLSIEARDVANLRASNILSGNFLVLLPLISPKPLFVRT